MNHSQLSCIDYEVLILNLSIKVLCIYSSIEEGYTAKGGLLEWEECSRRKNVKCTPMTWMSRSTLIIIPIEKIKTSVVNMLGYKREFLYLEKTYVPSFYSIIIFYQLIDIYLLRVLFRGLFEQF
jgi:hypothetical protein